VVFLFALLLSAALPAVAQPAEPEAPPECVAAREALRAAHREHVQTQGALEDLRRTGRALYECSGAPVAWRISGLNWEIRGLMLLGRNEEAERLLDRFVATYVDDADAVSVVVNYSDRAILRARRDRPLEALSDYQAALAFLDQLPEWRQARLLLDISTHYDQLGDHDRALQLAEEAASRLDPEEHPAELARALYRQAMLAVRASRRAVPEDVPVLQNALARARRSVAVLDGGSAIPLHDYRRLRAFALSVVRDALVALERPQEALGVASEALQLAREGGQAEVISQMVNDYADVLIELGRADEALVVLEESIEMARGFPWMASLYYRKAEANRRAGRLDAAEVNYREAIDAVEAQRRMTGITEWSALGNRGAYYRLASLLLERGRQEEAFEWLDAARARRLRDLRQVARGQVLHEAAQARVDSLRALQRRARASLRRGTTVDPIAVNLQIANLEAEIASLVGFEAPGPRTSLEELQAAAGRRGGAVLSYYLPSTWRGEASYVFVLTGDTFHTIRLEITSEEFETMVRAAGLMGEDALSAMSLSIEAAPLRRLYDVLFRPVEHLIPAGTPVTVIPDGAIAYVPFGMLVTGDAPRFQYQEWPFLVHRHPFSTELAVALLDEPSLARRPIPLAAFGRSVYEDRSAPTPFEDQSLGMLPHVPAELRALRRQVRRAQIALDGEVRRSDLLSVLPYAQVLHLASHAFVHPENPLFSTVVLFDQNDGEGSLFLYDLVGREVNAELVVLSACQTAAGRSVGAEGFVGLQYAFRAAGARASLAMRWQVDDAATVFLMERFYHHLRRGHSKDVALQQAQIDYLAAHRRLQASPFFWAAADLAGDTSPVDWPPPGLPSLAWVLLGLLLVALSVAVGRWKRSQHAGRMVLAESRV
jgi:CHAT domain-containing protein/tetratricopeptide (TPR) repeat protein